MAGNCFYRKTNPYGTRFNNQLLLPVELTVDVSTQPAVTSCGPRHGGYRTVWSLPLQGPGQSPGTVTMGQGRDRYEGLGRGRVVAAGGGGRSTPRRRGELRAGRAAQVNSRMNKGWGLITKSLGFH